MARNEDYLSSVDPTMVITPRGMERVGSKEHNAVRWSSKYGNVCMYANNRFPMDGINEKGLTARPLFFTQGKEVDAAHPDRPALDSDHWISYVLDNFATVKAAVAAIHNDVRLNQGRVKTQTELARKLGTSKASLTQILNLLKLAPEIRAYIKNLDDPEVLHFFNEKRLKPIASIN